MILLIACTHLFVIVEAFYLVPCSVSAPLILPGHLNLKGTSAHGNEIDCSIFL